jgi:hypothetical protein
MKFKLKKFLQYFMWLTVNKLNKHYACDPGVNAFKKAFPLGAPVFLVFLLLRMRKNRQVPGTGYGTRHMPMFYGEYIYWIRSHILSHFLGGY